MTWSNSASGRVSLQVSFDNGLQDAELVSIKTKLIPLLAEMNTWLILERNEPEPAVRERLADVPATKRAAASRTKSEPLNDRLWVWVIPSAIVCHQAASLDAHRYKF